jgi:hypothetical protein
MNVSRPPWQDRLDFASHWIVKEEDYSITAVAIQELVSAAKTDELLDLLQNMDNITPHVGMCPTDRR